MMPLAPLMLRHIAVVVPSRATATCGGDARASFPATARSIGAPKLPPGGRVLACTVCIALMSERPQIAVVVPSGATAISGPPAFWPLAERSAAGAHDPWKAKAGPAQVSSAATVQVARTPAP